MMSYFIGVDVGSGSVRAALVDSTGKIIQTAVHPIKTFNPQEKFYEQSSNNIWIGVCHVVKVRIKFYFVLIPEFNYLCVLFFFICRK